MKQTALVSGGAGFIGSHLCEYLAGNDYRVVAIDNLLTGRRDNIQSIFADPDFTFVEGDVTDPKLYEKLPGPYDYIFHLASPASPNPRSSLSYMAHPLETMMVNSQGTKLLLDLAQKFSAKFLFASTSEVYGDPLEHPQKETYWGHVNPNGLRSCYDESKRFGEAITMVYQRNMHVDARLVRIFNTYGPRMNPGDGRVIVDFVVQALKEEPFMLHGDGNQTRSFCYVSDMVSGITKAMFTDKTNGEVFNLGNSQEYTINQLLDMVIKKTKVDKKISHSPLPADDPQRRRPDTTKAQQFLNWHADVSLDEGLDATIAYFRDVI